MIKNKLLTDLQDLKSAFISHCKTLGCSIDYITMCQIMFANIENTLKEYEELQKDYCDVVEKRGEWQEKTNKKLQALDVIKEREVNIYHWYYFKISKKTFEEYNEFIKRLGFMRISKLPLTQDEFYLLKEVLLCK